MNLRAIFAIAALIGSAEAAVRADAILLKGGGELRGELLAPPRTGGRSPKVPGAPLTIRTLTGTTVSVAGAEVDQVVHRRAVLEEYETLKRAVPDTVAAQWEMAEWCRRKNLSKERAVHLQRIVELDPEHVPAHRGLGHVHVEGYWTTTDQIMQARGYVKRNGKYVLPQELELLEAEEQEDAAAKAWFKRVKLWESWLDSDRPERTAEGFQELKAIRDANAVPALNRTFRDNPNLQKRLLYIEILNGIGGAKPLQPLVQQSLRDESQQVRDAAVRGVRLRDVDTAVQIYLRALKNELNVIVNRAATALGQLHDDSVVPLLIESLVTRHRYKVTVPEQQISIAADGSSPSGSVLPPSVAGMLATGQLPYGVQVQSNTPQRVKQVTVQKDEQNPSVLTALNTLTGEDFGFDEQAWRRWHKARVAGVVKPKKKPASTH